jgi:hypothetical protein
MTRQRRSIDYAVLKGARVGLDLEAFASNMVHEIERHPASLKDVPTMPKKEVFASDMGPKLPHENDVAPSVVTTTLFKEEYVRGTEQG